MKRILFLLVLLCLEKSLHAQYVYTIKADSVKITNTCDTAELIIENHTQTVPGFLFNKGRGRTEFRRASVLNDSSLIFGGDTLLVRGNIKASNGLSIGGRDVVLGQFVNAPGNPASLKDHREIPLNGYNILLTGNGKLIKGRTTDDGIGAIQNAGSYSYDKADTNGIYAGSVRMLGQKAASTRAYFGLGNTTNISGLSTSANVIVMGTNSGSAIVGGDAFIVGNDCGSAIVSPHNFLAIGKSCLTNATVNENLAVGHYALNALTTGPFNNAVGQYGALINATSGLGNDAFGTNAGAIIHTGNFNLCLGHNAGGGNSSFPGSEATQTIFINPASTAEPSGQYFNCLFVGMNAGKKTSNANDSIINSSIFGSFVTTDLDNICVVSNNTQHVIIPSTNNVTADNGARLQVYGTGFFSDTLTATTMSSGDNSNRVATTAFVKNAIGAPALSVVTSGATDYSAAAGTLNRLPDLSGAGSHSVTLPAASSYTGQRIYLWNMNSSSNSWTFASSITLPDGSTSNTIPNQSTIELLSDGNVWIKWK
jgi:hypothetical protein